MSWTSSMPPDWQQRPEDLIIHKFGRNPAMSTAWEDVWMRGGHYTWPIAADNIEVVSDDADDALDAAGAQLIGLQGLDANWDPQTEFLPMHATDGTNRVTSANTFIRMNRAWVEHAGAYSVGATGGNIGTITIDWATANVALAEISEGVGGVPMGQTQIARFTIPDGYVGYVLEYFLSVEARASKTADFALFQRPKADIVTGKLQGSRRLITYHNGIVGEVKVQPRIPWGPFEARTDIWWSCVAEAASAGSADMLILCRKLDTT